MVISVMAFVRPSVAKVLQRKCLLTLALEKCCELGIKKVLISCDKNNIASSKTIIKNSGVLENEFAEENRNIVQRYCINL